LKSFFDLSCLLNSYHNQPTNHSLLRVSKSSSLVLQNPTPDPSHSKPPIPLRLSHPQHQPPVQNLHLIKCCPVLSWSRTIESSTTIGTCLWLGWCNEWNEDRCFQECRGVHQVDHGIVRWQWWSLLLFQNERRIFRLQWLIWKDNSAERGGFWNLGCFLRYFFVIFLWRTYQWPSGIQTLHPIKIPADFLEIKSIVAWESISNLASAIRFSPFCIPNCPVCRNCRIRYFTNLSKIWLWIRLKVNIDWRWNQIEGEIRN